METRKIAFACFIGGLVCCSVALLCAPMYWWFGLIAGMAGGYISHEFVEVRKAVPIAFRTARRVLPSYGYGIVMTLISATVAVIEWAITKVRAYFAMPHPFAYPAMVVALPVYCYWFAPRFLSPIMNDVLETSSIVLAALALCFTIIGLVEVMIAASVPFVIFAFIGARFGERCFWYPFVIGSDLCLETQISNVEGLEAKGLQVEPLNYRNVARWVAKGVGISLRFVLWTWWTRLLGYGLAFGIAAVRFVAQFVTVLFVLVHTDKRVLCAIDGTIGGAVSYLYFASKATSVPEQLMFVVFGGLLGAALGVANWEIVSKGLLRVHEKSASA